MKTILAFREEEYAWAHEAFPCVHPLLLPLCNKPFIEFVIDFAILTGSSAVRLLCDGGLGAVEEYCENGSRWGIDISYGSIQPDDTIHAMLAKNRKFCGEERVMIVSGFSFIRYEKRLDYKSVANSMPAGEWVACPGGRITLSGVPGKATAAWVAAELSIMPLDSMASYYRASMEALETGADRYVLPGYGGEPGCAFGRNVVISKSVEIRKPVSIGNNVQLLANTVIGPSAIIGSNVIIDRESSVESSIVLDNTYIGEHLALSGRIASGNHLNDPKSGTSIAMEDPHLLSRIQKNKALGALPRKIVHGVCSLLMIVVLFIPFIILWPLLKLGGHWKSSHADFLSGRANKTTPLGKVEIDPSSALGALAVTLSLDRYSWLFRVLTGQLALIGNTPLPAENTRPDTASGTLTYRPGVFSYAEAEQWPTTGGDAAIVERFHLVHSSPLSDIGLVIKAFINRLHEKSTI
jgi:hypothetical protein